MFFGRRPYLLRLIVDWARRETGHITSPRKSFEDRCISALDGLAVDHLWMGMRLAALSNAIGTPRHPAKFGRIFCNRMEGDAMNVSCTVELPILADQKDVEKLCFTAVVGRDVVFAQEVPIATTEVCFIVPDNSSVAIVGQYVGTNGTLSNPRVQSFLAALVAPGATPPDAPGVFGTITVIPVAEPAAEELPPLPVASVGTEA